MFTKKLYLFISYHIKEKYEQSLEKQGTMHKINDVKVPEVS